MSEGPPPPPPSPPPSSGAPRGPMPQAPRVTSGGKSPWLAVGLILGVAAIVVLLVLGGIVAAVMLPALGHSREAARRASCQNNLKQFGIIYAMHAEENNGQYPSLSETPGEFIFDVGTLYPEYLADVNILICPSDEDAPDYEHWEMPESLAEGSYVYLGYAIHADSEAQTEQMARAYVEACREHAARGEPMRGPLTVTTGAGATATLEPLREGIDVPPHEVPVMFDRSPYHHDYGINVLYLDGHVEFVQVETKFPALWWFLEELDAIEAQYAE